MMLEISLNCCLIYWVKKILLEFGISCSAMKMLAKWSVGDYHRMIRSGILRDRPVELLAGEVCQMSPETRIHYNTTKRGTKYLEELLAGKASASIVVYGLLAAVDRPYRKLDPDNRHKFIEK